VGKLSSPAARLGLLYVKQEHLVKGNADFVGLFNSLTPGGSKLRATTAKPPQGRFTQPPQGGFAPVARNLVAGQ